MAATQPNPQITVHPAAAIFPMMSDEEIAEMANSIQKHGLREKIHAIPQVTDTQTDWLVVDGRNRLEAIRRHLKLTDVDIIARFIAPVNLTTLGATPEEYVMMANIERRNLSQAQRRELAGKLALMLEERQKNLPKDEQVDTLSVAAEKAGVSRRTAATSKAEAKVKAKAPEQERGKSGAAATPAKEKPYVPLRPSNVKVQLEAIAKTVGHEAENEVGGKKVRQPELDKWTIEEVQEAQKTASLVSSILDAYVPARLEKEQEALEKKLAALAPPSGG